MSKELNKKNRKYPEHRGCVLWDRRYKHVCPKCKQSNTYYTARINHGFETICPDCQEIMEQVLKEEKK